MKEILRREAVVIGSFLFFIVVSLAVLLLYQDNKKLIQENNQLRIINSTTDKMRYFRQPIESEELKKIIPAASKFIVDPFFLLAVRNTENGRFLFEFGCNGINERISETGNPELFQYEEAAYTIALAQKSFAMKYCGEFTKHLSESYAHESRIIKKKWSKSVIFFLRDFKKRFSLEYISPDKEYAPSPK